MGMASEGAATTHTPSEGMLSVGLGDITVWEYNYTELADAYVGHVWSFGYPLIFLS